MAAGLGFKTFTTGEVLTAADTNGYLMQGVLVFASSAARASAITSPQEGQYSYLKDTDALEYYSGSAWVGAPVGDITGVTAGTGISGGGTSGTVTVTNSMATAITTNGDLIYGTGSGTFTRLGIGSSAQVLTVAGGVPSWATPAAGASGLTLIQRTTFSAVANTGTSFDGIFTSTYAAYDVVIETLAASGAGNMSFQFRVGSTTQTGSNYVGGYGLATYTNTSSFVGTNFATSFKLADLDSQPESSGLLTFTQVGNSSTKPVFSGTMYNARNDAAQFVAARYNAAIVASGFILAPASGTISGTIAIYGRAK